MTTPSRVADTSPADAHRRGERRVGPTASAGPVSNGPVIVLAPAYSGASAIRALLEDRPSLACTTGTGLLPLCEQAIDTWRRADGRQTGQPSSLATIATRTMANSVITAILAREGKRRWCEIAAANPEAAETFLRLYPETRFLCLYRACPGVVRAALDASPWGITDLVFAPFIVKYPTSTVAALTAYWVTATGLLLDFEREHPQACLRVRYEDLSHGLEADGRITSFLGLDGAAARPGFGNAGEQQPSVERERAAGLPADLLPPALLAQANDLLRQLGYRPMTARSS